MNMMITSPPFILRRSSRIDQRKRKLGTFTNSESRSPSSKRRDSKSSSREKQESYPMKKISYVLEKPEKRTGKENNSCNKVKKEQKVNVYVTPPDKAMSNLHMNDNDDDLLINASSKTHDPKNRLSTEGSTQTEKPENKLITEVFTQTEEPKNKISIDGSTQTEQPEKKLVTDGFTQTEEKISTDETKKFVDFSSIDNNMVNLTYIIDLAVIKTLANFEAIEENSEYTSLDLLTEAYRKALNTHGLYTLNSVPITTDCMAFCLKFERSGELLFTLACLYVFALRLIYRLPQNFISFPKLNTSTIHFELERLAEEKENEFWASNNDTTNDLHKKKYLSVFRMCAKLIKKKNYQLAVFILLRASLENFSIKSFAKLTTLTNEEILEITKCSTEEAILFNNYFCK